MKEQLDPNTVYKWEVYHHASDQGDLSLEQLQEKPKAERIGIGDVRISPRLGTV
jgi:hypothetical protein